MKLDHLPEDCIAHVLSLTSPRDVCKASVVSSVVHDAAESDLLWGNFLPLDYREILSRLAAPVIFTSKKELFLRLANPVLIDGGNKTFSLDKLTSKKCYMLSAKELSITWATNSLYWCWKPHSQSRFDEVIELIIISWLEIRGKIKTQMLSPNTTYGAYLIIKFADRAVGLDSIPSEVSVEVGNYQSQGTVLLRRPKERKPPLEGIDTQRRVNEELGYSSTTVLKAEERVPCEREDGWLEVELGEFFNDGSDREVKMSLKEVKGEHLKGGLVVQGIELRPKY